MSSLAQEPLCLAVSACGVCGGPRNTAWKDGNLARDLAPEDLHITDARYGVTLRLVRCDDCGFIFAPASEIPDVTGLYEQMEDPEYESSGVGRRYQMRWILKLLRSRHPAGRTLLDIGAGTGMLIEEAQQQGWACRGVEPSHALSATGRARGLDVLQGVYPHPSLDGRRFDAVTLIDVIEHVEQPGNLLRHAAEALAPNGLLVVITPDISSLAARWLGHRWWHLRLAHIGYFSPETFARLAAASGLRIEKTVRAKWFFPVSYLAERVEVYLPWVAPLNRALRRRPLIGRLYESVIPLNLRDSSVFFLRRSA